MKLKKIRGLNWGSSTSKFDNLGDFTKALHSSVISQLSRPEQLINEIAAITQTSPEEVEKFYYAHDYTLAFIKQIVLQGAELDKDSIERTIAEGILPPRLLSDFEDILKKTWRDHLANILYYSAYYLSYPFIWLVFWLWQGILQAKEKIWD